MLCYDVAGCSVLKASLGVHLSPTHHLLHPFSNSRSSSVGGKKVREFEGRERGGTFDKHDIVDYVSMPRRLLFPASYVSNMVRRAVSRTNDRSDQKATSSELPRHQPLAFSTTHPQNHPPIPTHSNLNLPPCLELNNPN